MDFNIAAADVCYSHENLLCTTLQCMRTNLLDVNVTI